MQDLFKHVQDYLDTRFKLLKLEILEKVSRLGTNFITTFILIFLAFFFLLFASISAGLIIGNALNAFWLGFLIVALFYFALAIGFYLLKDKLIYEPILNAMVKALFTDEEEEDTINFKQEKDEPGENK